MCPVYYKEGMIRLASEYVLNHNPGLNDHKNITVYVTTTSDSHFGFEEPVHTTTSTCVVVAATPNNIYEICVKWHCFHILIGY